MAALQGVVDYLDSVGCRRPGRSIPSRACGATSPAFFVHTSEPSAGELEQLKARGVQIVRGQVARLVVEADRLSGVELIDRRVIRRTAVFIRPVHLPHPDGLLAGLGCDVDEAGFAVVDATGRTSAVGVWAAGNVVWLEHFLDMEEVNGSSPVSPTRTPPNARASVTV